MSSTSMKVSKSNAATPELKVSQPNHVASAEERQSQEAFVNHEMEADREATLKAEQARIAAELKAIRDSKPTVSPLEKEIARQSHPAKWFHETMVKYTANRIKFGQSREQAIEQVLASFRAAIEAGLDAE